MSKKTLFKGRPDFPNDEPLYITGVNSTNDTDEVYCIDTLGQEVTLGSGIQKINDNGTKSASSWAGVTLTGVLYGRWTNVKADSGVIACYIVDVAVSES